MVRGLDRMGWRRSTGGLAGVLVTGALVGFVGTREADPCRDLPTDSGWTSRTGRALEVAWAASGSPLAEETSQRVLPELERRARAWERTRGAVCGTPRTEPVHSAQVRCLESVRVHLRNWIQHGAGAEVERLVESLASLPAPSECEDVAASRRVSSEGPEWTEARVALTLGERDAAREAVRVARATSAPGLPLGSLIVGRLALEEGDLAGAEAAFVEAFFAGQERGEAWVQRDAAMLLVELIGREDPSRNSEIDEWLERARRAHALLEQPRALDDVMLLRASARAHQSAGRLQEALDDLSMASALLEQTPEIHPLELAEAFRALAIVGAAIGDHGRAAAALRRAIPLLERTLGEAHPRSAATHYELGRVLSAWTRPDAAIEAFRAALQRFAVALGPGDPSTLRAQLALARVLASRGREDESRVMLSSAREVGAEFEPGPLLGALHSAQAESQWHRGEEGKALEHFTKALQMFHPDHAESFDVAIRAAIAHLDAGEPDRAKDIVERCLAQVEKTVGPRTSKMALASALLGRAHADRGSLEAGREWCDRSLAIARLVEDREAEVLATSCLVDVHLDERDVDVAERRLTELESTMGDARRLGAQGRARLQFARARTRAARGEVVEGRNDAERAWVAPFHFGSAGSRSVVESSVGSQRRQRRWGRCHRARKTAKQLADALVGELVFEDVGEQMRLDANLHHHRIVFEPVDVGPLPTDRFHRLMKNGPVVAGANSDSIAHGVDPGHRASIGGSRDDASADVARDERIVIEIEAQTRDDRVRLCELGASRVLDHRRHLQHDLLDGIFQSAAFSGTSAERVSRFPLGLRRVLGFGLSIVEVNRRAHRHGEPGDQEAADAVIQSPHLYQCSASCGSCRSRVLLVRAVAARPSSMGRSAVFGRFERARAKDATELAPHATTRVRHRRGFEFARRSTRYLRRAKKGFGKPRQRPIGSHLDHRVSPKT